MNNLGLLLLLTALLAGCTSTAPTVPPTPVPATPTAAALASAPTPQTLPTPTPTPPAPTVVRTTPVGSAVPVTPTAEPVEQSNIQCSTEKGSAGTTPEIEEVIGQIGFAFRPSALPEGFEIAGVSSDNNAVSQIYQNKQRNIIIAYPIQFSPETTSGPLGWERPGDAVRSLQIGNQTAHIMTGGWSDASIIAGPALSADKAEWDYHKSLALFFTCHTDDGRDIDMAIQALPGPMDWISASEIVEIALSLKRVSRSR